MAKDMQDASAENLKSILRRRIINKNKKPYYKSMVFLCFYW